MRTPRYEQIAEKIVTLIHSGALKEGDKIPSIRQLSHELSVGVNTVKEAYWRLEDRNYITVVPQSGYYVKNRFNERVEPSEQDLKQLDPKKVTFCRVYSMFRDNAFDKNGISLALSGVAPDLWPKKRFGRYLMDAASDNDLLAAEYLLPPGYTLLRQQIARLGLSAGLTLSPDDIIVTNGCQEAIFLALMALCKPGDTIVLESPTYFNLLQLLQALNLKVIEIPSSPEEGISLDTLKFVIENHPVKVVFSIPNFNNPRGFVMPSWKKKEMAWLLEQSKIPLIEDDIYGDLYFHRRPDACKSHDETGNVLYCSSFSKTIAPGLRIGWIAPGKFYESVIEMKMLLNISTASVNQIAVACFLAKGGYERHLRKVKGKLIENVQSMRNEILLHFPDSTRVSNPSGGSFLWVELPEPIDTEQIYQDALAENILFSPGHLFSLQNKFTNCMRLSASTWNLKVADTIQILGRLCKR
ncbi:PLP-dependent aminotransferase family protein [Desulfospira joergensenii]|uniref:aminotransferase-like domain-containing protein n=1 Tax=Desulfospira joergensenii TaxID=53329 RepID=UPI0003B35096|nr:PLP-dependent aminotransferase family protein [Desulfospira joergensenii]